MLDYEDVTTHVMVQFQKFVQECEADEWEILCQEKRLPRLVVFEVNRQNANALAVFDVRFVGSERPPIEVDIYHFAENENRKYPYEHLVVSFDYGENYCLGTHTAREGWFAFGPQTVREIVFEMHQVDIREA